MKEGTPVDVVVEGDHLMIRRKRLRLANLLAQCNPANRPTRSIGVPASDMKSSVTDAYIPERGDFARMVLDPYTGRNKAESVQFSC